MNSGDWVENLSALEFNKGEWRIYNYDEDFFAQSYTQTDKKLESLTHKETFELLLKEFNLQ